MHILLLGKKGQLGWELQRTLAVLGEVTAWDKEDVDLVSPESLRQALGTLPWDVIVNASAYTAVEKAEVEKETARSINAEAPRVMAEEARKRNATFIHFSTDYVFDGLKAEPYHENDIPNPLNMYGLSKLEGERAVQGVGGAYFIFRTSWVYSMRGDNFVAKVIKLSREKKELRMVIDQTGCPTWARALAELTSHALCRMKHLGAEWTSEHSGLYHLASWDHASRYDLARHIVQFLELPVEVKPALTQEFPSSTTRPPFSAITSAHFSRTFELRVPTWREMLEFALVSFAKSGE